MSFLRHYLTAIQRFTLLPITGALGKWVDFSPEPQRGMACHLPGVGWLAGLVACTAFALTGLALPSSPYAPLAAAVACTIATVLLTGAIHEEALTDFVQVASASHGTVALVLALLFKIALLAVLAGQSPAAVLAGLLAGHVVSRFWPLVLMRRRTDAGDEGTAHSHDFAERVDGRSLAVAAGWCILPLLVAFLVEPPAFAITGVVLSGLAWLGMRQLLAHRSARFNPDCVGATQQVCEIAFYLGAAVGLAAT